MILLFLLIYGGFSAFVDYIGFIPYCKKDKSCSHEKQRSL